MTVSALCMGWGGAVTCGLLNDCQCPPYGVGGDSYLLLDDCQCPLYVVVGGTVTCGLMNDCQCPLYGGGGTVTCGLMTVSARYGGGGDGQSPVAC